jgi:hypothetical protein
LTREFDLGVVWKQLPEGASVYTLKRHRSTFILSRNK